jgi:hypothetical protein
MAGDQSMRIADLLESRVAVICSRSAADGLAEHRVYST